MVWCRHIILHTGDRVLEPLNNLNKGISTHLDNYEAAKRNGFGILSS